MATLGRIDVTKNFLRVRQKSPTKFHPASFRMKRVGKRGVMIVVACPKRAWNPKTHRCRKPMQVQSIVYPRKR